MATLLGCLCLILALFTTGSRSAIGVAPRSLDSSLFWDQDPLHLRRDAERYRDAADCASAEPLYWHGYRDSLAFGDRIAAVKFLISVGACQLQMFRYTGALSTLLQARDLAKAASDRTDLGAIAGNLSSVFLQVWDVTSALQAADEGLAATEGTQNYSRPYLLIHTGRLHAILGDRQANAFFSEGIESARRAGNRSLEAQGWDWLGDAEIIDGRLTDAERAFGEAFRLRLFKNRDELRMSYFRLAALRLAQDNPTDATRFNTLAAAGPPGPFSWPAYLIDHQRGQIHRAQGQIARALADFSAAVDAGVAARLSLLPSRASLVSANIQLEETVFRSFIQLAAHHALLSGDHRWAEQAFQAAAVNRAASLRESLSLSDAWRGQRYQQYWKALGQLAAAEANQVLRNGSSTESARLRLKLSEMEAQAGLGISHKKIENFRDQSSLIHFRGGLRRDELLLNFSLGKTESYLWTVSREQIRMYRLPPEEKIGREVAGFRDAVRSGDSEAGQKGESLYRTLFGQLAEAEEAKQEWVLSMEGSLYDVPLAALVVERKAGKSVYLVERHSVQVVPGALLLSASLDSARRNGDPTTLTGASGGLGHRRSTHPGAFLGVGDPVYNTADPQWESQWTGAFWWARTVPWVNELPWSEDTDSGEQGQLNRLVASAIEVSASAASWRASGGTTRLLLREHATRDEFLQALGEGDPRTSGPAVIHLATHVLVPATRRELAFVAFGMKSVNQSRVARPEYLTTSEIAALRVHGALVVMTGCSTGLGDAQAGAGLLGLTQAWLMAGASGVISTQWPVEDSAGDIFSRFYHHLSETSPAEALRRSQVEMIHSGTWRGEPSYWASYQITGGAR